MDRLKMLFSELGLLAGASWNVALAGLVLLWWFIKWPLSVFKKQTCEDEG